ncbi:MAG: rhomboid family intramembrane serine protease [Lachnospiraceae bacterium]|nr:rhomboid family intramembrane serine protease [Lachnospiraceae bacterium]
MSVRTFKKIEYNSPVILTFAGLSLAALIINYITFGESNKLLFSVYRSSPNSILFYLRLFLHVLGHENFSHYIGNMMLFLLLGPIMEEKYGSRNIIIMIASIALMSGFINIMLFPRVALLGASGVVFGLIVLSSMTGLKGGKIPLTLILVLIMYLGQEIYSGLFVSDNVSQLTHIIGGMIGCIFGFALKGRSA